MYSLAAYRFIFAGCVGVVNAGEQTYMHEKKDVYGFTIEPICCWIKEYICWTIAHWLDTLFCGAVIMVPSSLGVALSVTCLVITLFPCAATNPTSR